MTPPTTLAEMTKAERSLLLFLECRAVDHGGLVCTRHMNLMDFEIAENWAASGFIQFGRLTRDSIAELRGSTHWVTLSETAWMLAHQERRARFERLHGQRRWIKTIELS